jgi:hypothetical protein
MVVLDDFRYSEQHEKLVDFILDLACFDPFWKTLFQRHREEDKWDEESCLFDFVQLTKEKSKPGEPSRYTARICAPNSIKHFQLIFLCYVLCKPEKYDADKIMVVWKRRWPEISHRVEPKIRLEPLSWCIDKAITELPSMVANKDFVEYIMELYTDFKLIEEKKDLEIFESECRTYLNKLLLITT